MRLRGMLGVIAVLVLAACSSSGGTANTSADPYAQTWTGSYADTTCDQWLNQMTSQQQFAAAHDFIVALKAFDQTDTFARSYQADITRDCRPAPSLHLSEVAAAIATLGTNDFPR